jgi:hypothetical protein
MIISFVQLQIEHNKVIQKKLCQTLMLLYLKPLTFIFRKCFEDFLHAKKQAVPFASAFTKDGNVFTIQYHSVGQHEEFKEMVLLKTPFFIIHFKLKNDIQSNTLCFYVKILGLF